MVSMLDRKLFRDLWRLRGQILAIGVVVACGVAIVMTTRTSYQSLVDSRAAYYADYKFADVFAHLTRAPETLRARITAIPGVEEVETRIQVTVVLDVPGLPEPATGRILSLPAMGQTSLNRLHLRQGTVPEAGRRDQIIVSEAFATANQLGIGNRLGAILNGRWQQLAIAGIALSPEYVYEIGAGAMFPDNRRFGVVWMNHEALAAVFDMTGAFNDVTLRIAPGFSESEVISRLDRLLEPHGGLGAYGRADQISARFLADEIDQNRVSGTIVPAIFLGVAAFLLHIVLARFVGRERQQIAVLKAFGYASLTIGGHYVKLALAALFLGAVGGIGLGLWFAQNVNQNYANFFRFPSFLFRVDYSAVGLALLVTTVAALAGAAGAVRRAVRITPAAAMQPDSPERYRPSLLERTGMQSLFATPARIIFRSLERRPVKALLSCLGIAFAAAILVVGSFFLDAMKFMADVQFRLVQREDLAVVLVEPRSARAPYELGRLPGVLSVEGFRSTPVRISAGHRSRKIELLGLEPRGELRRVLGTDQVAVDLPPEGLVLTAKLAEILAIAPGDTVTVQVLEGKRRIRRLLLVATVNEMLGLNGYIDRTALNRVLGEGTTVTGALLRTDPLHQADLLARLKRLPSVAAVTSRNAAIAGFQATLDTNVRLITTVLIGFAGALAVAMVYNTGRITLAERSRELASLRVLGFTRREVTTMLLGEQAILTSLGIAIGLGLGYGLAALVTGLYQWELFRIPLVIAPQTYVTAAVVVLAAAILSGTLVARQLRQLDLVAVLKTPE